MILRKIVASGEMKNRRYEKSWRKCNKLTMSCELIKKKVKNKRERERERERVGNRWMMWLLMWFNRSI